jgi:hypothetical protein
MGLSLIPSVSMVAALLFDKKAPSNDTLETLKRKSRSTSRQPPSLEVLSVGRVAGGTVGAVETCRQLNLSYQNLDSKRGA